jgi:hypothetical protein
MNARMACGGAVLAIVLLMSGCTGDGSGQETSTSSAPHPVETVDDVRWAVLPGVTYASVETDPEVRWEGRLVERGGCVALETAGGTILPTFFADAVVVRDIKAGTRGVQLGADGPVLWFGIDYEGSQGVVAGDDEISALVDGPECAAAIGTATAAHIYSGAPRS